MNYIKLHHDINLHSGIFFWTFSVQFSSRLYTVSISSQNRFLSEINTSFKLIICFYNKTDSLTDIFSHVITASRNSLQDYHRRFLTDSFLDFLVSDYLVHNLLQLYNYWTSSTQTALDLIDAWFRVFFFHWFCQVYSLDCDFTR